MTPNAGFGTPGQYQAGVSPIHRPQQTPQHPGHSGIYEGAKTPGINYATNAYAGGAAYSPSNPGNGGYGYSGASGQYSPASNQY